jgi:type II secretory pathway pseudopilin PulG
MTAAIHRLKRNGSAGFTLIELLIICPILMAVIAFLMNYLFNQYGQLTQQNAQINLQVTAQAVTFSMQDDIFFANAFVSDLNSNLVDNYAPSGGWQASSSPTVVIISTPALTASHRIATRQPVYINTLGCSPAGVEQENDALYNNVVYWTSGSNLYKRVVTAPSSMSTCGSSYQKQTCPSAHVSSTCPADILMTDHLSSFTATYYDTNGNQVTTPEQATEMKVDVRLTDQAYAQTVTADSNLTLRRINQ